MDLHGCTWIYMDLHGFTWIYMDLHGLLWIYMDLHGFTWIYIYIYISCKIDVFSIINAHRIMLYQFIYIHINTYLAKIDVF